MQAAQNELITRVGPDTHCGTRMSGPPVTVWSPATGSPGALSW